jgi:hypothetical protein
MTGHPGKKCRLDGEERPSGELGYEQPGARAAERVHDKASWATRELVDGWQTFHTFSRYRAVRRDEVIAALTQAGSKNGRWLQKKAGLLNWEHRCGTGRDM